MIVIVGGLIALGVVAAIAVVLLARGESRVVNTVPQQIEQVPEVPAQREQEVAPVQEQQAEAQMAMATADTGIPTVVEMPEETLSTTPTVETNHREQPPWQEQADRVSLPVAGEGQLAAGLASQYEVLTRELHEVHQKSNEIERKLRLLNETAMRFERMQDGHSEDEIERMRRSEREINTETDLRPTPSRILDPYR